jgi:5-methyltetrahydrofolate--homocysteine methyltransferase
MKDVVFQAILIGDADRAVAGVLQALEEGEVPQRLLNEQMIAAMVEVGRLYEEQEYFIPEMMISARAMQRSLRTLEPKLTKKQVKPLGKFMIGTVKGDLHDIGKNLVAIMMEGVGFEVSDLGTDVSPEKFAEAVLEFEPDILGMSALLTTTMPYLGHTIRTIEEAGLRDQLIIMVGGAPVSQEYAKILGADLYASDAASAAKRARDRIQSH